MKDEGFRNGEPRQVPRLYSETEAALLLNMTPLMLARRRRAGKITSIKDGRLIAYTLEHLADYQRRFQRKGTARAEIDTNTLIKVLKDRLADK